MTLSKSTALSPEQLQRLEKIRAKGRSHYILYTGMLGWGLPVFAITSIWSWHDRYGWQIPPNEALHNYLVLLPVKLVIWLVAGYLFCEIMWNRMMDKARENEKRGEK